MRKEQGTGDWKVLQVRRPPGATSRDGMRAGPLGIPGQFELLRNFCRLTR